MNKKALITIASLLLALVIYFQITIFVVSPIGAVPEGKTIIISRLNKTNFIDSADAMCLRIQDGVSLLCRAMVMGSVLDKSEIYLRLPYMKWLYLISTNGKEYSS
jgi:hypothetical protein